MITPQYQPHSVILVAAIQSAAKVLLKGLSFCLFCWLFCFLISQHKSNQNASTPQIDIRSSCHLWPLAASVISLLLLDVTSGRWATVVPRKPHRCPQRTSSIHTYVHSCSDAETLFPQRFPNNDRMASVCLDSVWEFK